MTLKKNIYRYIYDNLGDFIKKNEKEENVIM